MRGKTITAVFRGQREARTAPLFQYDFGQVLLMEGIELPAAYEVHFGNTVGGESITAVGDENGVAIPDDVLKVSGRIYAWVYLHEGLTDGETEYTVIIPVTARGEITDAEPTPAQQSALDAAIAALNAGVTEVEGIAEAIPGQIDAALTEAKGSGEFDGTDGYSPTVEVTEIQGGHEVAITDVNGTHTFDVLDGTGGGATSPTANVVKTDDTAIITITDINGTTTASISDGKDGTDGEDGQDGLSPTVTPSEITGGHRLTIVDVNGTTTVDVMDGTDGTNGSNGTDGTTFTPSVAANGDLSWTNDGGKTNPATVNIMGPQGPSGEAVEETVTGTTPSITAVANHRYVCGEVSTLSFTPSQTGICDVVFTSGSTATVLTVPSSVRWPDWFDPTSLEANATYEINVLNGVYGAVGVWT